MLFIFEGNVNWTNQIESINEKVSSTQELINALTSMLTLLYNQYLSSAPPKISITQIVKYLKGISGNTLLKEFPELRNHLWKGQLWNGSYFCETIGSTSEENILRYIERQKNCQL